MSEGPIRDKPRNPDVQNSIFDIACDQPRSGRAEVHIDVRILQRNRTQNFRKQSIVGVSRIVEPHYTTFTNGDGPDRLPGFLHAGNESLRIGEQGMASVRRCDASASPHEPSSSQLLFQWYELPTGRRLVDNYRLGCTSVAAFLCRCDKISTLSKVHTAFSLRLIEEEFAGCPIIQPFKANFVFENSCFQVSQLTVGLSGTYHFGRTPKGAAIGATFAGKRKTNMSTNACSALQSRNAVLRLLSTAIILIACLPTPAQAQPRPSAANVQAELDALIKLAKAEGNLIVYSSSTENVNKRAGDGLEAKYGIKVVFVRSASGTLMQRFAAEAEAGNPGGDVLSISGSTAGAYADNGARKGWIEPLAQANLPVLKSGEFPAVANRGTLAMIQAVPFQVAYNTERLKGEDVPKSFQDLTNPKYKGQIILLDPRVADAYMEFYAVILDRFGPGFLELLRGQNPRFFTGGLPAVQALAAGEGWLATPMLVSTANILTAKGAALATLNDAPTAWVEQQVMLTVRAKSKSPNAARLFVNYVMSPEGNQVFNNEPGSTSIYSAALLRSYKEQKPLPASKAAEIVKLLGL